MPSLEIFNPGYLVYCGLCGDFEAGVIIRKRGDPRIKFEICGRCLSLAMMDITKQDWLSQWIVWQHNSKLGKEIQARKRKDAGTESDAS